MTNIWLHSKQSMKGMDLLEVATDVLYALEQQASEKPLDQADLRQKLDRGRDVLKRLDSAAEAQTSRTGQMDIFMLRVAEGLEKSLGLPPSELAKRLEDSSKELERGTVTEGTVSVFEKISDVAMRLTSRSVDAISISLH